MIDTKSGMHVALIMANIMKILYKDTISYGLMQFGPFEYIFEQMLKGVYNFLEDAKVQHYIQMDE